MNLVASRADVNDMNSRQRGGVGQEENEEKVLVFVKMAIFFSSIAYLKLCMNKIIHHILLNQYDLFYIKNTKHIINYSIEIGTNFKGNNGIFESLL